MNKEAVKEENIHLEENIKTLKTEQNHLFS